MTRSNRLTRIALALALGALIGGCTKGGSEGGSSGATSPSGAAPSGGGVQITDAARAEAKEIFGMRCLPCHGATGEGNGPASASLSPKPRNFTDAEWQGKVTDEHIEKIIQFGGAAVGKSPAMPPNPDLTAKPETVAALREHIRSLKK